MDNIFVEPDGTERPFEGPVPRIGEEVELDSFAQFQAGSYKVKELYYAQHMFKLYAIVRLEGL